MLRAVVRRMLNLESEDSGHEFASIAEIVVVLVVAASIVFGYFAKKYKFYYLPESAFTLLLGMVVGGIARAAATPDELKALTFRPELFFFILLPPIIFDAGYNLQRKRFFRNFSTIVMFAVVGTLISTFVIGFGIYGLGKAGALGSALFVDSPMPSLLFGALISAVDPVATLAIMGSPELNCDKLLYSLVFGESVLNDAVAIVLFDTFKDMAVNHSGDMTTGDYFLILGKFVGISLGSVISGVGFGLFASFVFKWTGLVKYPSKEITLLFLFAYASYAVAEAIGLSGIMALFFTGITLSHYNTTNLSSDTQEASHHVFHAFAHTTETIVFGYMGICVFTGQYGKWSASFVVLAIIMCLIARACNIFPLSFLANLRRKTKIPSKMQAVMWFAGLRGAIAFALAINMPNPVKSDENAPDWADSNNVIVSTTLCVVIFTTVVAGGFTEPMLASMGMKTARGRGASEDEGELAYRSLVPEPKDPNRMTKGGLHGWWKRFDYQFMRPTFGGALAPGRLIGGKMPIYSSGGQHAGPSPTPGAGEASPAPAASSSAAALLSGGGSGAYGSGSGGYQGLGTGDIGAGSGSFYGVAGAGSNAAMPAPGLTSIPATTTGSGNN